MTDTKKVLIVEDDLSLLDALDKKFSSEGLDIDTVKDGQEAMDYLEKNRPALVVLDIIIPKIDGMQVLHRLREKYKDIPVIMLTNLDANDQILQQITLDAPSYYLTKATTPISELVDKAKEILFP